MAILINLMLWGFPPYDRSDTTKRAPVTLIKVPFPFYVAISIMEQTSQCLLESNKVTDCDLSLIRTYFRKTREIYVEVES